MFETLKNMLIKKILGSINTKELEMILEGRSLISLINTKGKHIIDTVNKSKNIILEDIIDIVSKSWESVSKFVQNSDDVLNELNEEEDNNEKKRNKSRR